MGTDGFLFVQDEKLRWLICTIYLLVCAIQCREHCCWCWLL